MLYRNNYILSEFLLIYITRTTVRRVDETCYAKQILRYRVYKQTQQVLIRYLYQESADRFVLAKWKYRASGKEEYRHCTKRFARLNGAVALFSTMMRRIGTEFHRAAEAAAAAARFGVRIGASLRSATCHRVYPSCAFARTVCSFSEEEETQLLKIGTLSQKLNSIFAPFPSNSDPFVFVAQPLSRPNLRSVKFNSSSFE